MADSRDVSLIDGGDGGHFASHSDTMWLEDFEMATLRPFTSFFMPAEMIAAETTGADADLALASSIFSFGSFGEVTFDSAAGALLILVGG